MVRHKRRVLIRKDGTYRTGEGKGEVGVGDTKRIGAAAGDFDARTTGEWERGSRGAERELRVESDVEGTVRPKSCGMRN